MASRNSVVIVLLTLVLLVFLLFAAQVNEEVLGDALPNDATVIGAAIADWGSDADEGKDLNRETVVSEP